MPRSAIPRRTAVATGRPPPLFIRETAQSITKKRARIADMSDLWHRMLFAPVSAPRILDRWRAQVDREDRTRMHAVRAENCTPIVAIP
jgi:hypothetical protein